MISVCQLICVSGRVLIIVQSANKVHIRNVGCGRARKIKVDYSLSVALCLSKSSL